MVVEQPEPDDTREPYDGADADREEGLREKAESEAREREHRAEQDKS